MEYWRSIAITHPVIYSLSNYPFSMHLAIDRMMIFAQDWCSLIFWMMAEFLRHVLRQISMKYYPYRRDLLFQKWAGGLAPTNIQTIRRVEMFEDVGFDQLFCHRVIGKMAFVYISVPWRSVVVEGVYMSIIISSQSHYALFFEPVNVHTLALCYCGGLKYTMAYLVGKHCYSLWLVVVVPSAAYYRWIVVRTLSRQAYQQSLVGLLG